MKYVALKKSRKNFFNISVVDRQDKMENRLIKANRRWRDGQMRKFEKSYNIQRYSKLRYLKTFNDFYSTVRKNEVKR